MVDTARSMITNALLDINVLADGETPTATQAAGGLRILNNMIDSWNIKPYRVYGAYSVLVPLISNQGTYTWGTGGNINSPRPGVIQSAFLRNTTLPANNVQDIPLPILSNFEFQNAPFKAQTTSQPYYVYINETYPLTQVTLYPIPTDGNYSVVLWYSGLISNFALDDQIILAPGYSRAIQSNLAIELSPSYGAQVDPSTQLIANESLQDLTAKNFQMQEITGIQSTQYDIRTNLYWSSTT